MARQVDRLLAQLATDSGQPVHEYVSRSRQPASTTARRSSANDTAHPMPARPRGGTVALWARLGLAVSLGVGITQWPYSHACGTPLLGYLGAVAMVILAAIWIACFSWQRRSPVAHVVALGLFCWGMVLAAQQALPRVGYAAEQASWHCTPRAT